MLFSDCQTTSKLSVIIPFVSEHPQIAFTVQALGAELIHGVRNFEVIVIDNHCPQVEQQWAEGWKGHEDGGGKYMSEAAGRLPWLKYLNYTDKLSHWQCKNLGVRESTGDILLFLDSHVVPSQGTIAGMFLEYAKTWETLHGTMHLPLSYMLDHNSQLRYKLKTDLSKGIIHYAFTHHTPVGYTFRVPAMSTCGMMMHRSIYDDLGGWPVELGIYGGGENFMNFCLAVLGYNKWLYSASGPLYHYAAPRSYHFDYVDFHHNRAIANWCIGGEDLARLYVDSLDCPKWQKEDIWTLSSRPSVADHAAMIQKKKKKDIKDWLASWP